MNEDIMGRELADAGDLRRAGFSILKATSSGIDASGNTNVVLYWSRQDEVVGYNLYRSKTGKFTSRNKPVNGARLIAPVRTCSELQAIIPRKSKEWNQLTRAFNAVDSRAVQAVRAAMRPNKLPGPSGITDLSGHISRFPGLHLDAELKLAEIDPCDALGRGLTPAEEEAFDMLANSGLRFRLARGLAFIDTLVTASEHYVYELRGVVAGGNEIVLASNVLVWAGHFTLPDPPSGLSLSAGDRKVLALWNRNPYAYSYEVHRSLHPTIGFQLIHAEAIRFDIEQDLNGEHLPLPQPGLLDFQRWDVDGLPVDHDVNGVMVSGPENGNRYYYRVASIDILERRGGWGATLSAKPVCSLAPMAPDDFRIDPNTTPPGLMLSWRKVTRNVENHQIQETSQSYEIYRAATQAEMEDLTMLPAHLVTTVTANPSDPTTPTLSWIDTDPLLFPAYGEQDFWYRIRCIDQHGGISAPSALIAGRVPDTTPPGPTELVDSEGFADHIRIYWNPNTEPDLGGYQIYRGICNHGVVYMPEDEKQRRLRCDMILVGAVSLKEAEERLEDMGVIYFDDFSVPPDSPLCYAYWVRAHDAAQNLYEGMHGCPKPDEYLCQRLYEETAPPAPVITALKARNNAVLVEWIGSPVQDLRAFHVYRSDRENDPPDFIGCVLSDGTLYPDRWKGERPSCADIPAEPNPIAVHASFVDAKAEPNRIYWYRVSALDWLGNESESADLTLIPAISTFTYSCDTSPVPTVLPPLTPTAEGCGLEVRWNPAFSADSMSGFVVFRSSTAAGDYRQVSPVVQGNAFSDPSARRRVDYWYKVQAVGLDGRISLPSAAVHYRY